MYGTVLHWMVRLYYFQTFCPSFLKILIFVNILIFLSFHFNTYFGQNLRSNWWVGHYLKWDVLQIWSWEWSQIMWPPPPPPTFRSRGILWLPSSIAKIVFPPHGFMHTYMYLWSSKFVLISYFICLAFMHFILECVMPKYGLLNRNKIKCEG